MLIFADTVVVVDTEMVVEAMAEVEAEVELDMVQLSLVVAIVVTQQMATDRHARRAACQHRDMPELQL